MKFFRCSKCGNLVAMVEDSGVPMICCGEPMTLLEAGVSDGAAEKHVPALTVNDNEIHAQIGDVLHPATEEHHIDFICLETNKGFHLKYITVGADPITNFTLSDDETPIAVYEYCNLHGLWVKNI